MSSSTSASATSSAVASSSHAAGLGVDQTNPTFKIVGVCLAVGSGLFIGTSFVIKKKGLLKSTEKTGNAAGEGHAYLKSWLWWTGMTMMIIGEILNFVAYAFTVAILVTPMGSISVVVAAILSHYFLQESLTFFGWIGCILCILGSIILALNAPEQNSVRTIKEFRGYFVSPGFLTWAGICIAVSIFIVVWVAPRYGKRHMLPYISVCSLIGGISVSCTQGLGASIITSIHPGPSQVKDWFFWFLFMFVVVTLLIEINYLNKALELFNTSMVVPVYFCYFTSATMITSFILYRGLKASAPTLITMVLGFLVTCFGITILQMSKVDPTKLQGLDRRSTILLQAARQHTEADEKGDLKAMEDPGMDALRGGFGSVGSIIRARSIQRRRSTMSSQASQPFDGYQGGTHLQQLSTAGLSHLPRYQLNDTPMHDDVESIGLAPQGTGSSTSLAAPPGFPQRSRSSTLKFDDQDTVHQYGYGGRAPHAVHSTIQHEDLRGGSQSSGDRALETITELSPGATAGNTLGLGQMPRSVSHASQKTALSHATDEKLDPEQHGEATHLWQLFGFGNRDSASERRDSDARRGSDGRRGSDARRGSDGRRGSNWHLPGVGGDKRSTRDYPRSKEEAAEREERQGLVESPESFGAPLALERSESNDTMRMRREDSPPSMDMHEVDIAAPRPIGVDDGRCSPTSGRVRPTGPR